MQFVENNDAILTMGVSPTRPEPGYGYIQKGVYTGTGDIYKVQAFTEKPDRQFAQMFMDSKNGAGTQVCSFLTPTTYASAFMVFFHPSFVMRRAERRLLQLKKRKLSYVRISHAIQTYL